MKSKKSSNLVIQSKTKVTFKKQTHISYKKPSLDRFILRELDLSFCISFDMS